MRSRGRLGVLIVSVPVPEGTMDRLVAAGVRAGLRAGRLRLSFHLHNTEADVDTVVRPLRS